MNKVSTLEPIGYTHLPTTILGALQEYFHDSLSFEKVGACHRMIMWEPQPQEVLQYYWHNLRGSILAFGHPLDQMSAAHSCFEYVMFLNQPCRFQDLRSVLQRKPAHTFWKVGPYLGDFQRRHLIHHETMQVIELTEKEAAMLEYLCQSPNYSIDRENLLKDVWKYNAELTTHTLETHIYRLRQKLSPHENLLLTTETGYMLVV
jgi:hypothetical protein